MNEPSKKRESSNRDEKASTYRRVVTGNINGRSVVQSDQQMEAYQFNTVPGYQHTLVWINAGTPDLSKEQSLSAIPTPSFRGPAAPVCTL